MALITLNNRSINRSDTASSGQAWVATSATASDFQAVGGTNTPMVEVKPAGNQTIATGTWTKVTLDSEQIDTDSTFASDKWTPGFVGKVFIVGITYIASLGDAKLYMNQIYKNGSATGVTNIKNSGKADDVTLEVAGIFTTDADDYFELYVHHQHGSDRNNIGNSTRFYGFKLLT